jgi:plasmid stabilization system protein ParE
VPHVTITDNAGDGIRRCTLFLLERSVPAAKKAAEVIKERLSVLASMPDYGTPYPLDTELRQITIPFGDSGYIALYLHDKAADTVYVLAFRHQKEEGY